jgi:hypothetical protein
MEADLGYYRRRAAEERAAAAGSANRKARGVHLELAWRYDQRVEALVGESNAAQLRLVPAA